MIICLFIELEKDATPENLLDSFELMPGLVKGAYNASISLFPRGMPPTLEEIEMICEDK